MDQLKPAPRPSPKRPTCSGVWEATASLQPSQAKPVWARRRTSRTALTAVNFIEESIHRDSRRGNVQPDRKREARPGDVTVDLAAQAEGRRPDGEDHGRDGEEDVRDEDGEVGHLREPLAGERLRRVEQVVIEVEAQ